MENNWVLKEKNAIKDDNISLKADDVTVCNTISDDLRALLEPLDLDEEDE